MKSPHRVSYLSGLLLAAHLSPALSHQIADPRFSDAVLDTRFSASVAVPGMLERQAHDAVRSAPFSFLDESLSLAPFVSVGVSRSIGGSDGYELGLNGVPLLSVHQGVVRTSLAEFFDRIRDSFTVEDKEEDRKK